MFFSNDKNYVNALVINILNQVHVFLNFWVNIVNLSFFKNPIAHVANVTNFR